jgi:hypothetical protein
MTQIKSDTRIHNRPKPVMVKEAAPVKVVAPKKTPKPKAKK